MRSFLQYIILFTTMLSPLLHFGQTDTANYSLRKSIAYSGSAIAYSSTMLGTYFLWYKGYNTGRFHTFNDNNEWFGIDKMGHATTAFHVAKVQSDIFKWSGMNDKKAALWGSSISLAFLSTIEVFDGFSEGWGFSSGDIIADIGGVSLYACQELLLQSQPVHLKFSVNPTQYAQYNPKLLGKNFIQKSFKDYNGQTYWLSFNIASCLKPESSFPKWLNIAVGYGADGMIGAGKNPSEIDGQVIPHFQRYPQFYLSPDIDFSKIKIKNPWLAFLVKGLNFIKIPAPTLEWNRKDGMQFHAMYF